MNNMSKISLEKFVNETKGTKVDVPWESDGHLKGQCVSLVQQYLVRCLEQPAKPRGNAKDWINTYVNEGLGTRTSSLRKGDLLVFPNEANGYGHIAIYVNEEALYDQNNLRHDNGNAGYGAIFSHDYVALRPNAELVEDKPVGQTLSLPASATSWRVYPMGVAPVVGNECGKLLPSKFGGLEYEIKGWAQPNVAVIQTRDFGEVQIYVAPSTGAIIR
jgi:hypothetical protein